MRYQPALDVYRGYCIIAVFLFHALILDCGWIGVQAFFVISGFLITGVLLEARRGSEKGARLFINFYARRALRIFPVYLAFIFATLALAYAFTTPLALDLREHVFENAPYLLTYTYNFHRINGGPGSAIYMHLWSLSIEEQFYLFWPALVFLLAESRFVTVCLVLVASGPLLRAAEVALGTLEPALVEGVGKFVYVSTLSHLDAFALGALLNFDGLDVRATAFVRRSGKWVPPAFAGLTILMWTAGFVLLSPPGVSAFGWPLYLPNFGAAIWGYSLINLFFFTVIARIRGTQCPVGQRMILRIGRVSYGFYVFHLPILWFTFRVTGAPRTVITAHTVASVLLAFALTWLLAEASFRWLEQPLLGLKRYFPASAAAEPAPAAQS